MAQPDTDGIDSDAQVKVSVNQTTTNSDSGSDTGTTTGIEFQTRRIPLPEKEDWFKTYWRPAAAWLYLFINLFDFVIAPVLTALASKTFGFTYVPWVPLTTSGGQIFHLSFGAIIGVTAWGRTRERVTGLIS